LAERDANLVGNYSAPPESEDTWTGEA